MRYWVYPNPIQGTSGCLVVPQDTLIDHLPGNIQGRFAGAKPRKTIALDPAAKYAGLQVSEALRDIQQKGYHIVGISTQTLEQWPGRPAEGA